MSLRSCPPLGSPERWESLITVLLMHIGPTHILCLADGPCMVASRDVPPLLHVAKPLSDVQGTPHGMNIRPQ